MYILSAGALWCCCIHRAVLKNRRREKERAKKTQERFCGTAFSLPLHLHLPLSLSLFLARHLTSPGKRQIRFRLLSRQSKLRKSFFFSPSSSSLLSLSRCLCLFLFPFLCLCFISVDAELWRPLTRFSNNNSSPPQPTTTRTLQVSSLPEPYTCQHILWRALNRQQTLSIFTTERERGAHPRAPV